MGLDHVCLSQWYLGFWSKLAIIVPLLSNREFFMPNHQDLANAIRALAMDAVECAKSGHPGMPMGMADIATVLWREFLHFNPQNPHWFNRDRFIVSNGHGSMLLYALLYLTGYDLALEELKNFRQLHSKTPGHPEYGETPGVETTTGPLGQGLANAVGMALAEKILAAQFNRPEFNVIDHHTYCFMGDGGMMEGISHEAASLAGTWGLGKLIVFWDDNSISIDGDVAGWFTDNTPNRFKAYDWHVIEKVNGHDPDAIRAAIEAAQAETEKPSLICCQTKIGYGAPNLGGTAKTHGAPLGEREVSEARKQLNWNYEPFVIPENILQAWNNCERGEDQELLWNDLFVKYESAYPQLAHELLRRMHGALPEDWQTQSRAAIEAIAQEPKTQATRKSSLRAIEAFAKYLPELVGGSADLTESNCTLWKAARVYLPEQPDANYIHYGVREFGMSAIMNGIALHKGFVPFGGTFLTFSDYARNAVRLAALMQQKVIFVYTHDSIGLGEDGPTHQPVEQLASLRIIPNLYLWRPADDVETAVAWREALQMQSPTALVFSRQNLPALAEAHHIDDIARGAYVLWQADDNYQIILLATGSEVELALQTAKALQQQNVSARVVSMPCCETFMQQEQIYQDQVLPPQHRRRVAIEAGATNYWYRWVGLDGVVIGLDQFGASAPAKDCFKAFGFTVDNIISQLKIKGML